MRQSGAVSARSIHIHRTYVKVCALFLVALAGCAAGEDIERADAAVANFHRQFNAAEFHEIYDRASDEFKQSARKEEMARFFENVRTKLGQVTGSKKLSSDVNYHTSGTIVTLTYETSFAKGVANEVFMYRTRKSDVILAGYRIDSRDLIGR